MKVDSKKDAHLAAVNRYSRDARLLTEERDKALVKARIEGATLRELAENAGMECLDIASILGSHHERQL